MSLPAGSTSSVIFRHLVGFTTVVVFVNQLVRRHGKLAALAQRQKDELADELELAAEVQPRLLPRHPPVLEKFAMAGQTFSLERLEGTITTTSNSRTGTLAS